MEKWHILYILTNFSDFAESVYFNVVKKKKHTYMNNEIFVATAQLLFKHLLHVNCIHNM